MSQKASKKQGYKKTYTKDRIYGNLEYGGPAPSRGLAVANYLSNRKLNKFKETGKILVLGSGPGYELVYLKKQGFNVVGAELYIPDNPIVKKHSVQCSIDNLPFKDKEFLLTLCCETLEHIPMEVCEDIIEETKRVSKAFCFTIATRDDGHFNTHININEGEVWIKKFRDHGLKIQHAQIAPGYIVKRGNTMALVAYDDGVLIYGEC